MTLRVIVFEAVLTVMTTLDQVVSGSGTDEQSVLFTLPWYANATPIEGHPLLFVKLESQKESAGNREIEALDC